MSPAQIESVFAAASAGECGTPMTILQLIQWTQPV